MDPEVSFEQVDVEGAVRDAAHDATEAFIKTAVALS